MPGQSFLTPIIDLVFPPRCPLCGDPLARHGGLCVTCWSKLVIPGEPACRACQRPLADIHSGHSGDDFGDSADDPAKDTTADGPLCAPCLANPPCHNGITAATLYNETSRRLVMAFKHGRRIGHAALLARLIVARLPVLDGEWLVVPVPLHRWRLWQRGFNQSALLARLIARATGQPLVVDALDRIRATPSLGHLNRRQRAKALQGAIRVRTGRAARLKGARVLLVDDVLTSGATTDACLTALRKAGVAKVRIAVWARVINEAPMPAARVRTVTETADAEMVNDAPELRGIDSGP